MGENRGLEIASSGDATYSSDGTTWHSAFQQDQIVFRLMAIHDIGLRRPQLFTVMTGVRP